MNEAKVLIDARQTTKKCFHGKVNFRSRDRASTDLALRILESYLRLAKSSIACSIDKAHHQLYMRDMERIMSHKLRKFSVQNTSLCCIFFALKCGKKREVCIEYLCF